MPFAGGIMQHGYQCGMLWGATLAAGAEAFRRFGPGPKAEAASIRAAMGIVESFRTRHDEINCYEITHIDQSSSGWDMFKFFLLKGGTIGCFKMAAWYAPLALEEIEKAFAGEGTEAPGASDSRAVGESSTAGEGPRTDDAGALPVSCTALLARRMGESEEHATMASGLAGGIGLCGGACGAMGTAIWLLGIKRGQEEMEQEADGRKKSKVKFEDQFRDPRSQEIIDRFLKATDFKFECSEIVGRTFEDADDHAAYVREGGCSELMEVLAGRAPSEPST